MYKEVFPLKKLTYLDFNLVPPIIFPTGSVSQRPYTYNTTGWFMGHYLIDKKRMSCNIHNIINITCCLHLDYGKTFKIEL